MKENKLIDTLNEVGEELAFHFTVDQRLHEMFESAVGDKNLRTEERMKSIRSGLTSKGLSRKLLEVIS